MNHETSASLFVLLAAAIGILLLIWCIPAKALECAERPDRTTYWRYRIIDGERCWFKGHRVLPKSSLHWPEEPKKREHRDPVFDKIRADAGLDAVTWHMRRPFDEAQPIIPPLNLAAPDDPDVWPYLSEFERRFVGVQP